MDIHFNEQFFTSKLNSSTCRALFEKYKSDIPLKFCFMFLYNNPKDNINDRLYYNEICDVYRIKYTIKYITQIYNTIEFNKQNTMTYKQFMYKNYCQGNCSTCDSGLYCF